MSSLAGFPGFSQRRRGSGPWQWWIGGWSGLLVPYRNQNGQIVFLQYRTDDDGEHCAFSTPPHKYDNGTSALRTAHVTVPLGVDPAKSERIWITEGGLKSAMSGAADEVTLVRRREIMDLTTE